MYLATLLKEGTKENHNLAENTTFILNYLKGVLSRDSYVELLQDFYAIYSTLERELTAHKNDRILGHFYRPELFRSDALLSDLKSFVGDDLKDLKTSDAAKEYINRIIFVSEYSPRSLIGHHYTRYLGDLSGGQVLKRITKTTLKVGDGALKFYEFPRIGNSGLYKTEYRTMLDALPLRQADKEMIVEEANTAFTMNINMFNDLAVRSKKNMLSLVFDRVVSIFK